MNRSDVFVADIFVDTVNRQLVNQATTRQLEPKVFKLLEVLIEANGDLITREQLNDRVWDGRVVGEGAINRTVSLLRQHFAVFDEDKDFIVTVPKAGYKLQYIRRQDVEKPKALTQSKSTAIAISVCVIAVFVAVIFMGLKKDEPKSLLAFDTPSRVSALPGVEYNISVDGKGDQILYSKWSRANSLTQMELKSLTSGGTTSLLAKDKMSLISQKLSPNSQLIVFAYRENDRCHIALYRITTQSKQHISECAIDSAPRFTWHWNNEDFYFRERKDKTQPYTISRFNQQTGRLSMMSLPPSDGNVKGDYLLSHHPSANKLLVVRYVNESKANLLVLDSFSGEKLFSKELSLHIDSVAWLTEHIIAIADKTNLYSFNVIDSKLEKALSTPFPISSMHVADNKLFYSLISHVSHLAQYSFDSNQTLVLDDANALAQLPRSSTQGELIYLSNKSGERQIHLLTGNFGTKVLANIDLALGFDRVEWSSDGQYLVLSQQGAIYRVNVKTQRVEKLLDKEAQAYVVNFGQSADELIYSSNRSGQWQLWYYNAKTKDERQLTSRGGYSGRIKDETLYFTKFAHPGMWQLDLSSGEEKQLIEDVSIINWLNWQIIGDNIYFYRPESGIWQHNLVDNSTSLILSYDDDMLHQFSVSADEKSVYFIQSAALEGDIYQVAFSVQ